jgi:pyruvate kinase
VQTRVEVGGLISSGKGINLPGTYLPIPSLTEKDEDDLAFALRIGADYIALSFVRTAQDVDDLRMRIAAAGSSARIVAKIEKAEAIENLDEIVAASDAVMVARGDLGVEIGAADVPLVQKLIIRTGRDAGRAVITATQMLESMIEHSRPTRAEASDVANAVLDGADAVMLSGETSVGKYPFITVATMARIIEAVESETTAVPPLTHVPRTKRGVLSYAARDIGERLEAKALVAFTQTGDTVRRLARLHTPLPLLAFTPLESTCNQLALTWGTKTFQVDSVDSTDAMVELVDAAMLEVPGYHEGDTVVIVAGSPPNTSGSTNLIRVHRLGYKD